MDTYEFYTQNNEYKIRITKKKKAYTFSKFDQYIITIDFIDNSGTTVYQINTNEKEFLKLIESLNEFCINIGHILSDNIYFDNNGDFSSNYIYISILDSYKEDIEFDSKVQLSLFHSSIQGDTLIIYIETDYFHIEDLVYKLYITIEDIPYLNDLINSDLLEFMDYNIANLPC